MRERLEAIPAQRIAILDGAMGTAIQAHDLSQADYGLEDAVYDINRAGAEIARAEVGRFADRFVAGSVGPTNQTLSISPKVADPAYRTLTFDELAQAYADQIRGLRDGGVDLLLVETIFDTLNAKAAIAAAREVARELLPRRGGDASVPRGPGPGRSGLHVLLPERRSAERVRGLRRAPGYDLSLPAGIRRERPGEHPRRLLRHGRRAHPRDLEHRRGPPAPTRAGARGGPPVLRARALRDPSGHRVRDDRRAAERDRLGAVPAADRVRRLPRGGRGRPRTGPERREPARREHGRGPARLRAGDDDVPEPDRHRARHRPGPRDDRLLAVVGDRDRAAMRAGQGSRELDLAEGRGGRVPRAGEGDRRLRGRGRGDGLRRARAGRNGRGEGRDPRAVGAAAPGPGGLRDRGHHRRPVHPRDRHRDPRARRVRQGVHRGHPADQGAVPRHPGLGWRVEPLLLLPRERPRPGGDPLGVPVPRDRGRARHGDRERRPDRPVRGHPRRPARARRGPDLRSPSRRHRADGRLRRDREGRGREARGRPVLARGDRRGAPEARARARDRHVHRGGHRGGSQGLPRPARGDRGPPDGGDADRRRPVRGREDVPPAGGEERPGDEEGGGLPRAVHGRGEGPPRHRRDAQGQGGPGDREGRRARHRQEHRRGGPRLQQLRGNRPRGDGAGRGTPRHRRERGMRHRRLFRPDHALAHRDGERGQGDGAARAPAAPAYRGGHYLAPAHRRQDRSRVHTPGGPRRRRVTGGGGGIGPARPRAPRGTRSAEPGRAGAPAGPPRRAPEKPAPADPPRPREPHAHRLALGGRVTRPLRGRQDDRAGARRAPSVHRLDLLLHGVGAEGQVPADPGPSEVRRRGTRAPRARERAPRPDRAGGLAPGGGRVRVLAGARRGRRPRPRRGDPVRDAPPASRPRRRAPEPLARRLRRPRGRRARGSPGWVRRHRGPRRRAAGGRVRGRPRRLLGDHGEGARRPAGRGLRRVAPRAGAPRVVRERTTDVTRGPARGAVPGDPPGVRLSGVPGPLTEADAVRTPRRAADRDGPHRDVFDDPRGERLRPVPRPPRGPVLQRRSDRQGPGRGLRGSVRHGSARDRVLAPSEPRVRPGLNVARAPPKTYIPPMDASLPANERPTLAVGGVSRRRTLLVLTILTGLIALIAIPTVWASNFEPLTVDDTATGLRPQDAVVHDVEATSPRGESFTQITIQIPQNGTFSFLFWIHNDSPFPVTVTDVGYHDAGVGPKTVGIRMGPPTGTRRLPSTLPYTIPAHGYAAVSVTDRLFGCISSAGSYGLGPVPVAFRFLGVISRRTTLYPPLT